MNESQQKRLIELASKTEQSPAEKNFLVKALVRTPLCHMSSCQVEALSIASEVIGLDELNRWSLEIIKDEILKEKIEESEMLERLAEDETRDIEGC